jgi:glutamate-5-semialdehyde dehydrogenase
MSAEQLVRRLCQEAKAASRQLAVAGSGDKNAVLHSLAQAVEDEAQDLQRENAKDLEAGRQAGLSRPCWTASP